jgi:glycosyltransferase involved in cell wall biosynthesis
MEWALLFAVSGDAPISSMGAIYLPFTFSSLMGVRTAFEAHSTSDKLCSRLLTRVLLRSRTYRGTVVISEPLKRHFLEDLVSRRPVLVLPSGAKGLESQPESRNSLQHERPVVGYAGSFYHGRGLELIVEMAESCPWAEFRMAGGTAEMLSKITNCQSSPPNIFFRAESIPRWSRNSLTSPLYYLRRIKSASRYHVVETPVPSFLR